MVTPNRAGSLKFFRVLAEGLGPLKIILALFTRTRLFVGMGIGIFMGSDGASERHWDIMITSILLSCTRPKRPQNRTAYGYGWA
jgi:hypothetical protein